MNEIFVIEGTDGSGKQTQTNLIYERLLKDGKEVFKTSFPNYDSQSSGPVKEYLSGNICSNPNSKENIEKYYLDDKTIILFDRYISSNLLHQGGKILKKSNDLNELDKFSDWVINIEENDLELPSPTIVFFLHVPTEYTISLMKERENKFSHTEKKDIHESDCEHLKNAEKSGLYFAKKFNWKIIECVKNGKLRSIVDINNEIYSTIQKYIEQN